MPPRSAVFTLPEELREEIDRRLYRHGFGSLQALVDYLAEQGYQISWSSLQRYSQDHRADIEVRYQITERALRQSRAVVEAAGGSVRDLTQGALAAAAIQIQESLWNLNQKAMNGEELDITELSRLTKSAADIGKATVSLDKYLQDLKAKLEASKAKAAEAAEQIAQQGGLTDEQAAEIRAKILGVSIDGG